MTSSKRRFIVAVVVCIAGAIVAGVLGTVKQERERGRTKAAVSSTQNKKGDRPDRNMTSGGIPRPVDTKDEVHLYANAARKFVQSYILASIRDIVARGPVTRAPSSCTNGLSDIRTTTIIVQIDGHGAVTGFNADCGAVHPASQLQNVWSRAFPTCAMDYTTPCNYNEITITAQPEEGWVFVYWWGDVTPGVSSTLSPRVTAEYARIQHRNYNPTITIALDMNKWINAHFVYHPDMSGLDLVGDLGEFLVTIGVNTEPSEVYNLNYDRGDFTVDGDANDVFTENGIPDAAEFALLEAVLKDATIDYAQYGGVVTHYVWKDWEAHVKRAKQDLPNASSAVVNTVAAYTTLGGYARGALIESLVNGCAALGATIDSGDYTGISSDWFGADDDPDANGVSNADVWAAVSSETFALNEKMVAAFAVAALNHDRTYKHPHK